MASLSDFEASVPLPKPFLPTKSFAVELLERFRKRERKLCFVEENGSKISYGEIAKRAVTVASFLETNGIQPGDKVCLLSKSKVWFSSTLLGCLLHSTLAILASSVQHALTVSRTHFPKICLHDVSFVFDTRHESTNESTVESSVETVFISIEKLKQFKSETLYNCPPYRGSVVTQSIVVYSGGCGGTQRAVVLPDKWLHYLMFLQDHGVKQNTAIFERTDDVVLLTGPLWRSPLLIILVSALSQGCTMIEQNHFSEVSFQLIERYKINCLPLLASSIAELAFDIASSAYDLSSVQYMICLSGPLPTKSRQILTVRLKSLTYIRQFYSLSECVIASRRGGQIHPLNVGLPLPGNRVKIMKDGKKCSLNVQGEVYVVGECMFSGYLDKEEVKKASDENGWFCTGDVGILDENGNIHVLGQSQDLFECTNKPVSTIELEDVLLHHPGIRMAAVIGVPMAEVGESARAYIVPRSRPEDTHSEAEGIRQFVRLRMPYYKQLHGGLEFVQQLPLTEVGMPVRRNLRETFLKG